MQDQDDSLGELIPVYNQEQYIAIHMGVEGSEVFRLTFDFEKNQVKGILAEGSSFDEAAKLFIHDLRFNGQALVSMIDEQRAKFEKIVQLANDCPNDMELGNKVRHYINENSTNRSRQ
jgi:hypothetical protein